MEPWVLVAGGFHRNGGMDRLNWALASYLIERGNPVHLVCHHVEPALCETASIHVVPKPADSFMLGGFLLSRAGRNVARRVSLRAPGTRVLVNGGNCVWPDINWVHCVHHAWERMDDCAPLWFKLKGRYARRFACRQERAALPAAKLLIANSERTRRDLIDLLQIDPLRVNTVYPGGDPDFSPPTPARRVAARAWLGKNAQRPLIAFVGALGHDSNKGFDLLFSAWCKLCARPDWNADLVVAGDGRALGFWRRQVAEAGLEARIMMLGFTDRISDLLAAVDLLVSPVRYESYGLNVHEAICCGIPAMVTNSSGVAERYPAELRELLIRDPGDVEALAGMMLRWRGAIDHWRETTASFSQVLRQSTLENMAQQVVAIAESNSPAEWKMRADLLHASGDGHPPRARSPAESPGICA